MNFETNKKIRMAFWAGVLASGLVFTVTGCKTEVAPSGKESVRIDAERYKVPVFDDDLAMGGEQPLVTIVVFTDYACPPCGTTWKLLDNLVEDYGDDIRVVYRSFTVPGFGQGEKAADAAFAASAQGKFWEMHRKLFEHFGEFDRPTLRAHAETIGLDVPQFLDDLDTGAKTGMLIRHRREAKRLGVRGLPVLFVNGLYMVGAQTDEQGWHDLIDAEIKRSKEMLARGIKRPDVYTEIVKHGASKAVPGSIDEKALREELKVKAEAVASAAGPVAVAATAGQRYQVGPGEMPLRGAQDPKVVVVEFLDFQCPFCRNAWKQTLAKLTETFPQDVALTVRHYPLEIHPSAKGVAEASVAAANQDKFWEFHDRLLAHEGAAVGRDLFVRVAVDLGLDEARFKADLDAPKTRELVQADIALGRKVGVPGTPGFFVNGIFVRGFSPGDLEAVIKQELAHADATVQQGAPRAGIANHIISQGTPEKDFPNP